MTEDQQTTQSVENSQPISSENVSSENDRSDDLLKLKKALESERRNSAQFERELKSSQRRFETVKDIDPELYKQAMTKAVELEKAHDEALEREQSRLRETESKYTAQLQEALSAKESALGELQQQRHRYALEKHFISAEGRTEAGEDGVSAFDMFWDRMGKRFRIDDADGSMGVIDANGDWVLDSETGKRLSVTDFIEQQKEHPLYSFLFKAKYGSGSGMGHGSDVRGVKGDDFGKLSVNAKFHQAFGTTAVGKAR